MHEPNLKYLFADPSRVNERYHERLREAEEHRLADLALGRTRARRRRLPARVLAALWAVPRGALQLLRVRRRLGAQQATSEP